MEKTIKYLENGEYHYATVKDVGDLAKLKTDSKDDLVTAINELFITGGEASKKPDGYDELVDNVADAIQKQQQMTDTITNMQQSAQLSDAEMQHMKQVQEEAHQDYIKALKEFNDAIAQANADALELDKKTDELKKNADDLNKKTNNLQDKLNETFTNVANEVSAVHKQLDTESAGLHKELNDTKTSLEATRKDLLNNTQEFGVVNSEVKELKDKMDRRIWSTDLDPVREQVSKNSTEVAQTKDELKSKADQSNLDLVTNSVENLSTQVKENADGLKVSVKKDELGGDVAKLLNDKTNLLLGTRNFSGDSWSNKTHWHEEPGYWKGLKVFSSTEMWSGLQYKYEVKQGQQYTFSFWARQEKDNSSASIVLSESDKGDQGIATPYVRGVHIGTEWKRYSLTFQAESDGIIYPRVEQNVQGNKFYIAGYKLELGNVATPWEPNEADVAENIEHTESQFNVYSDQIAGIVKKQEKMGDTERQLDTRITETAEGLKQTSKDLQDANGKITEFKGQLESTARGLKTEYEKYTNEAVGQISDSSLNLIRNSAFQNKDDNFAQWQNVSAKANIREDGNGLRWVELTQSGMTTSNPQGITSNYFVVKQGKVTVAVDIKSGDKVELDNESVLFLELYDNAKKRVDFHWVTLSDLGLSKSLLNDHQVHRGLYRLAIDRTDAQYMTVKAHLIRNGDLWFTNFSARLSSIDDGGYTPNPDDVNNQILKMNTKIEEDAQHIALKANSVDVTRDIKSAVDGVQVGGTNLLRGTSSEAISGDAPTTGWKDMDSIYNTSGPLNEKQYVLSFDARGDVDKQIIQTFLWAESLGGHNIVTSSVTSQGDKYYSADGNSYFTLTTQWTRYWVIYNVSPDNTRKQVIVGRRQAQTSGKTASGKVYIKSVKLEEGNKSTSWSPAPEDTSEEIKSAKDAAIQVASDQINIHVNELSTQFDDKLNKRINEQKTASEKFTSDGIEQTVTKITEVKNDVDRLGDTVNSIGSRNLLHNTSDQYRTLTGSDWFAKSTANDIYTSVANYHGGNQFTYAATITNPSNYPVRLVIYCYDKSKSKKLKTILGAPVSANQPNARVNVTTVMDTDTWWIRTNIETLQANTPQISIQVKDERLVEGTVSSSWSPNPDDINQSIKDATEYKTVTGTIDFNNLKTQQKIFYKDTQATNTPAGGSYWYYLDVEPGTDGRIFQTAISDRDNITWVRTFADSWSPWVKQADQRNIDDLNNQISSFKTETTASVKNLGDRVTTEVDSITTKINGLQSGGQNLIQDSDANAEYATPWDNTTIDKHAFYYNGTRRMFVIGNASKDELTSGCPEWFPVQAGKQYTLSFQGFMSENVSSYDVWLLGKKAGADGGWTNSYPVIIGQRLSPAHCDSVVKTFRVPSDWENFEAYIRFDNNGSTDGKNSVFFFNEISLKEGNLDTGYSPSPADTADQIKKLNTKWDVANGQIQGKVTETDVNNILNGKGYATQSWAQTMFTMKSDAITLQAVRDNITNGIQNQVNDAKSQINSANGRIDETNEKIDKAKIGERNLAVGTNRGKTGWTIDPGDGQSTMDDSWVNDAMGVAFNNSKKSTSWWVAQYPFDMSRLKPNTFYTISFDIQTDVKINGNGTVDFARGDSTGTPFIGSNGVKIITEPGGTTHVVHMAKTKGNIENNGQAFYFNSKDIGQANWVKIFNLMIVEGTQSIAWAAAPEDDDVRQKGVNLLKSSAYWSPGDWNIRLTDGSWVDDNWIDGLGHKAYGRKNGAWNGLGQTVYVTPGIYTWSAQIYVDNFADNDFVQVYMGDSQYNGTAQTISIRVPQLRKSDSDKWVNYSATFFVKNAGNLCVRPELNNAHGEVHVGSQKLEHGMVATPWTPAPTDDNTQTITLDSANIDNMKAQGHYFVKNLTGNPIPGWVYVDVTGNGNDRIKQDVYQDNGSYHKYRRWVGSWTEWVDDVNKDNILSQINISPEKIRLLSNKIEIDGNTYIHGTLNVPEVKLQGKSGYVDLSGDGINIAKNNGAGMNIGANAIQITSNTNGQAEVEGVITPAWSSNNVNQNGIGLILTTEQELGRPYGGDILTIGTMPKSGVIHSAMVFDATGITSTYKKGFNWFAPHTLNGDGGVFRFPNAQDDLVAYAGNIPGSRQEGYSQPTLTLVHGRARGSAGLQFQWDDLVPFGRITSSMSYVSAPGTAGNDGITVGWYSYGAWYGDRRAPCIIYHGSDGSNRDGGIVFYPGGEVCFWQGDFHSNLRWSGIKNTD